MLGSDLTRSILKLPRRISQNRSESPVAHCAQQVIGDVHYSSSTYSAFAIIPKCLPGQQRAKHEPLERQTPALQPPPADRGLMKGHTRPPAGAPQIKDAPSAGRRGCAGLTQH